MAKTKILFLTSNLLHGKAFGGQIRAATTIRALQQMGEVYVVFVDHDSNGAATVNGVGDAALHDDTVTVEQTSAGGLGPKFRYWLDPRFLDLHGGRVNASECERVFARMEEFDLVWFYNLRNANVFNRWHWPRSVMDTDDIPSTYERSVWHTSPRLSDRLKAGLRMIAAKRRERLLYERFTVLSVASEADRGYVLEHPAVHVIPNGYQRPAIEPRYRPTGPPRLGFIGMFDFAPNLEGIRWFARECWPAIKRAIPAVQLRLIGKGSDGQFKLEGTDIDGLGWVADPTKEVSTWNLMIVPIRLGAGTRIKIAEGFSRKCPIVSTSLGAYGYGVTNGEQLTLADTPQAFAQACIQLVRQPQKAAEMAEKGWKLFLDQFTWEAIEPRIFGTAQDCLMRSKGSKTI